MFDLSKFIDEKYEWSKRTFGEGRRTHGIVDHIKKECDEITMSPCDLEEWVDVILLAIDGSCRAGYSGDEIANAILTKQMKNVMREWPKEPTPEHLPIEHVRKGLRIISPYDAEDSNVSSGLSNSCEQDEGA